MCLHARAAQVRILLGLSEHGPGKRNPEVTVARKRTEQ